MKAASPKTLAPELADRIRRLRRQYRQRLEQCQRKFSETAVHQLRVATRRMLAMTELLESLAVGINRAKARRTFKQRLDDFSTLRDTQVQRRHLGGLAQRFAVADELERRLARQEKSLIKKLRRRVKSLRHRRMDRWLKRTEKALRRMDEEAGALKPRITNALSTSFKSVSALRRKVHPDRLATVHRLRIGFKHHRYLCELLQPLWPPLAELDLKAMRRFQTVMGDIQDCEVLLAGIREAIRAEFLTTAAAAGLSQAVLARRARRTKRFFEILPQLSEFQPAT